MTQEDKPIAIILPNWIPNEPRFIVEDAHDGLADDRAFKNGKCVYNQRLGLVYTVDYVVDALNELGDEIDKLKEENEQLKQELAELLAVHTKIVETLDSEFVSKALEDGD